MKKQHFKFTALCMLGLGMSQMALAETAPRQTLPAHAVRWRIVIHGAAFGR